MTPFPKNPFEPGFGVEPAYRGPRPNVESVLSDILDRTRNGARGSRAAFLYGPRGNGKTVLLRWLHAEAAAANVTTVRLIPDHLESPAALIAAVRLATRRFPRVWEWLSLLKAEYRDLKLRFEGADEVSPLAQILERGKGGLLLTLDEAHEAAPDMLGRFLNAVQLAGESRSVAVVFAGTPGLEATLLEAHASFWGRGRKLRIGLLEDGSARAALARPFRDAGLEADDGAVADLAAAADNYPYFLQLYGEAIWNAVEASGGRAFLPEHVPPALAAARGARRDYYRDRYQEFRKAGLLPLARRVADAFVGSAETPARRNLADAALDELLAYEGGHDDRMFLIAKGYVWQDSPEAESWTPGIPSLMDYMLERIPDQTRHTAK